MAFHSSPYSPVGARLQLILAHLAARVKEIKSVSFCMRRKNSVKQKYGESDSTSRAGVLMASAFNMTGAEQYLEPLHPSIAMAK